LKENASYSGQAPTAASAIFHDALTIIVLASAFGLMGFLYSLIDLTQPPHKVVALEPFRALTVQEVGGHFLFGFIAGVGAFISRATRRAGLQVAILIGLMALTIDADHILNVAKLPVQSRLDHSVSFAILSAPAMGLLAVQILQRNSGLLLFVSTLLKKRADTNHSDIRDSFSVSLPEEHYEDNHNDDKSVIASDQNSRKRTLFPIRRWHAFLQFSVITVAAVLSHIAYDVIADDYARFPLLNPLSFDQIVIPSLLAIPIEATAFFLMYLFSKYARRQQ